jgi:hypothetical protein
MKKVLVAAILVFVLSCTNLAAAQQSATDSSSAIVPTLVKYSGTLLDSNSKPLSGTVGVTFLLFKSEQGGAPLWLETQNVTPDKNGHYTVVLGSTTNEGLPADLFASGEARWLAVQAQGQAEQPRVLLLSVPYALKAGDAQTLGGLPASAFALAGSLGTSASSPTNSTTSATSNAVPPPTTSNVTTSGGTASTIPLFTTATNIQNSILTQTGTTAVNVFGKLNLPATGTATSTAGFISRPQDFVGSVFNSTTKTAVAQTFQLQAEPAGNNTSTASGTLNLLYATGTGTPAETGLKINNKGLIAFATGQTFPGSGTITGVTTAAGSGLTGGGTSGALNLKLLSTCAANQILKWSGSAWACSADANSGGTVTSVASGAGLTGGPITKTGTLSIANAGVTNTMLAHDSVTVAPGTGLVGGGAVALGGTTTLNLNTAAVPLLAANNLFAGNNSFTGTNSFSAIGIHTSSPSHFLQVDAVGAAVAEMAMVSTGTDAALSLTNTASGGREYWVDSGSGTAGVGAGNFAVWDNTAGAARMAINPAGNVGLGTTNPYTQLHLLQNNSGGLGPSLTLMNAAGSAGAGGSVDFDGYDTGTNSPTARIQSLDDGIGSSNLTFQTKTPGAVANGLVEQVRISDYGTLIADSGHNNSGSLSDSSTAGTGLEFGGAGSGEGIASCRSNSCPSDSDGLSTQYGLNFYTGHTLAMNIVNNGDVDIARDSYVGGCTYWGSDGDEQGSCLSDARLKTNIQPFPQLLGKLAQLEPVHFDWKASLPPELHRRGVNQTGLIAQQVEKIFPEMVVMGKDGYRRVNYGLLPYLLLQGVRELKESNDNLRAEGQLQRSQNEQARTQIAKLRKSVAATQARVARLDRVSARKDAQIAVMRRQIDQLRRTQQQMSVMLARLASLEDQRGKPQSAETRRSAKPASVKAGELARARF